MQRLPYLRGKSLALMLLGALVAILMIALGDLNGSGSELSVHAFYSPIRPPTPYPTPTTQPTPWPSPTPQTFRPPLLRIELEIELRKSIGFRSDIEYVEAVRSSDDTIIEQEYGRVALTPDEARELEVRIDLEKDGNALLNFFENRPEFQDSFGGIFLEHAAGSEDETAGGELILQLVKDHSMANDIPVQGFPVLTRGGRIEASQEQLTEEEAEDVEGSTLTRSLGGDT